MNDQNIFNFYQTAQERDFARVFQFKVTQFGAAPLNDKDMIYLETANLPGRAITNVQVPYMGLQFNVPGTATYPGSNNYPVTFRCDQDYIIRSLLENATFDTFNEKYSSGDYNIPGRGSTLTMELLGKDRYARAIYTLHGVYVVSLNDTAYDIKDSGTVATVQAVLAYQFWERTTIDPRVSDVP